MWWVAAVKAGMAMGDSYTKGTIANINADYQAKMARLNANLSEMKAEASLRQGEKQQAQIMARTTQLKASQKAGYAASGVDVHGSRSVTNVLTSTEVAGEVDRLQASANALTNAWSNRLQAVNYRNQALLAKASKHDVGWDVVNAGAASLFGSAANGEFESAKDDNNSKIDTGTSDSDIGYIPGVAQNSSPWQINTMPGVSLGGGLFSSGGPTLYGGSNSTMLTMFNGWGKK